MAKLKWDRTKGLETRRPEVRGYEGDCYQSKWELERFAVRSGLEEESEMVGSFQLSYSHTGKKKNSVNSIRKPISQKNM